MKTKFVHPLTSAGFDTSPQATHPEGYRKLPSLASRQRGVVLFIALIVLVALTLTGIALVRSVDTANLAAGNLSFKKGALLSSDPGIEQALAFVNAGATLTTLNANNPASGYYSTYSVYASTHTCTAPVVATASIPGTIPVGTDIQGRPCNWPGAAGAVPAGSVQLAQNAAGNTVTYVIQRMCIDNLTTGDETDRTNKCVADPSVVIHSSSGGVPPPPDIYYRVTAMVQGPRNTFSYVQTIVHK